MSDQQSRHARTTRRNFLAASAASAFAAPMIVPATALGRDGKKAPSDRIVMGCVGTGGKGRNNMGRFRKQSDVQVVAVCDVDDNHARQAKKETDEDYGNQDCKAYHDFRELVVRPDLDAVSVATPDHWHAIATIAALREGKHVYCEKPLANSIGEGRAIVDAAQKAGTILQCGSHERSNHRCRHAAEVVRSGSIGKLHTIRIQMPTEQKHHQAVKDFRGVPDAEPVPKHFDYDFWLGHTAKAPYHPKRCHFWWRFILAYGGGEMTDRGAHIIDIGQLGNDSDDTGPVEVQATGIRNENSLYDAFMEYAFVNRYADGTRLVGVSQGPRGVKFEGTDGWIFVHIHGGELEASDPELADVNQQTKVDLGRSPDDNHHRNFLNCVLSGKEPMATAEIGHRTATICHLNNIAMKLGRTLKWDPQQEQFEGDSEANALILPEMRQPWAKWWEEAVAS